MEWDREEELGEMYSPNESGEFMSCGNMPNFTVQGLWDALNEAKFTVMEPPQKNSSFNWKWLWQIDLEDCGNQHIHGMEAWYNMRWRMTQLWGTWNMCRQMAQG